MGFLDELRSHNTLTPQYNGNMARYFGDPGTGPGTQETMNNALALKQGSSDINARADRDRVRFEYGMNLANPAPRPAISAPNGPGMQAGQMNTVFRDPERDPYQNMTLAQREALRIDREKLGLDERKANEATDIARGKLGIAGEKQELDEKRNAQIYETKIAEQTRKTEEFERTAKRLEEKLAADTSNATVANQLREATIAATNARHELDLAQKQRELDESKRLHDEQIKKMQADIEAGKGSTVTTDINAEGTHRTVQTQRGVPPTATAAATPKYDKANPPPAPAGYIYVPKPGGGWTAAKVGAK